MKIIDLLNKIANGEEVPKKIKFKNNIYKWIERNDNVFNYKQEYNGGLIDNYLCDDWFMDSERILNDEIEIIEDTPKEEKKIPEKLKSLNNEIKEILEYYKRTNKNHFGYEQDKIITYKEAHLLLDYITNLQEENKILKKDVKCLKNYYDELLKMFENRLDSYLDLKSKIDKTIILLTQLQEKIINDYYIVKDIDLDNIMKELGDN